MPRSPSLTKSTNELAKYFGATTDASFIDKTWKIKEYTGKKESRQLLASGSSASHRLEFYRSVENIGNATSGISHAENISNLINGSLSFNEFDLSENKEYADQFQFYKITKGELNQIDLLENKKGAWSKSDVIYAANVNNPYLGPMTRDAGAIEVFANAMPTIELSKCVPYITIDVISLYKTEKTAPPMSLIGFLNPSGLTAVDIAMINGQKEKVSSESMQLGDGYRTGMELFLMPQTLSGIGNGGERFTPVIDHMRPFMSLKNLSMSTKMQGGSLMFTTGRLELVLHDRSRLRDAAPFVRPDLYGTTFLDIVYGWSHPDGDLNSNNSFGKFLNSLKVERRYRVSNASYSFEEGGQVNITLSIQTVGTIDLLYLGPRKIPGVGELMNTFKSLVEKINELRNRTNAPAPAMAPYDFITGIQDQSSILKVAGSKDFKDSLKELKNKSPAQINELIDKLIGAKTTSGELSEAFNNLVKGYTSILNQCATFSNRSPNSISSAFNDERFGLMNVIYDDIKTNDELKSKYMSYGDFFMQYIASPIKESGYYDEVQVIFYPFNNYAGLVHDLPISCFPIEFSRFVNMIRKMAESTPEITARMLLNKVNEWFTGFAADRSYLMADFYDSKKSNEEGIAQYSDKKKDISTKTDMSKQTTLESRCIIAGIPEARLVPGVIQVHVEGSKMYDSSGAPVIENGKTKTLIKIHVFDNACDPHSTLTDIMKSAKDNELDLFRIPVVNYNASKGSTNKLDPAIDILRLGLSSGAFEVVNLSGKNLTIDTNNPTSEQINEILGKNVYLRNKLDFDSLKKLISAGMPTITYGASTSVITNANLSSNSSPGLPNLMLQRAFSEPATTSAENVGSGPPMQIIPAQLSITTIGCPLFYPTQRFFVDFGTGTSLDNVYVVQSIDDKIGKDGFTSDVKLTFAEGFASYRSLDQNLRMMSLYIQNLPEADFSTANNLTPTPITRPPPSTDYLKSWLHEILLKAFVPAYETKVEVEEKIREEVEKAQIKIEEKLQDKIDQVNQKAEALLAPVIKAAETAKKIQEEVQYRIALAQYYAAQIAYYSSLLLTIDQIALQLGAEAAAALKTEVQAALAEAEAQAKANSEAEKEAQNS